MKRNVLVIYLNWREKIRTCKIVGYEGILTSDDLKKHIEDDGLEVEEVIGWSIIEGINTMFTPTQINDIKCSIAHLNSIDVEHNKFDCLLHFGDILIKYSIISKSIFIIAVFVNHIFNADLRYSIQKCLDKNEEFPDNFIGFPK